MLRVEAGIPEEVLVIEETEPTDLIRFKSLPVHAGIAVPVRIIPGCQLGTLTDFHGSGHSGLLED